MNENKPHEHVDIIIALGTAGVFAVILEAFKLYLDRNKLSLVRFQKPDGSLIELKNVKSEHIKDIVKEFNLPTDEKNDSKLKNILKKIKEKLK